MPRHLAQIGLHDLVSRAITRDQLSQRTHRLRHEPSRPAPSVGCQRADLRHGNVVNGYASFEWIRSRRTLGQEGYAARLLGPKRAYPEWIGRAGLTLGVPIFPDVPLDVGTEGILVGPSQPADVSIVEHGARFELPSYLLLDASLATRDLFLIPGHETSLALRARNLLGSKGPVPGFSGFEFPLAPREVFLEMKHSY